MDDCKIDILSINETKLDSTVHDSHVYIPGFEIVRKDHRVNGRKGGGVCVYWRTNLNHRKRDDLINDDLECLIAKLVSHEVQNSWSAHGIGLQTLRLNVSMNLRM